MARLIDADELIKSCQDEKGVLFSYEAAITAYAVIKAPTVDAVPVVRCRDCKHKPIVPQGCKTGFDIEFPDDVCPCQCDDGWYAWCPDDNWFCGSGEPKEGDIN